MSRKIVIMCAAMAFLALICTVEQLLVRSVTSDALVSIQGIMDNIRHRRFDEAIVRTEELDHRWDEQAPKLEILVDHGSTDDVRYALSRLLAALEEQDAATAMIYACELEGSVEHVFERQALTLENIL